jgi:hypothetical protein
VALAAGENGKNKAIMSEKATFDNSAVYLCSFADSRMSPSLKRVAKQALEFGEFRDIFLYDESALDADFRMRHKDKLIFGVRGYGYWIWKPYIILKSLEKITNGDLLIYLDAGCHLNPEGKPVFYELIKQLQQKNILCGSAYNPEKCHTKGDVFDFFGVRNDKEFTDTDQIAATYIFLKKTAENVAFVTRWLNIMESDFALIDDSPSKSSNFPEFKLNMGDQPIFSILCKLKKIPVIEWDFNSVNKEHPIQARRDKKLLLRYRYSLKRFLRKMKQKYF